MSKDAIGKYKNFKKKLLLNKTRQLAITYLISVKKVFYKKQPLLRLVYTLLSYFATVQYYKVEKFVWLDAITLEITTATIKKCVSLILI